MTFRDFYLRFGVFPPSFFFTSLSLFFYLPFGLLSFKFWKSVLPFPVFSSFFVLFYFLTFFSKGFWVVFLLGNLTGCPRVLVWFRWTFKCKMGLLRWFWKAGAAISGCKRALLKENEEDEGGVGITPLATRHFNHHVTACTLITWTGVTMPEFGRFYHHEEGWHGNWCRKISSYWRVKDDVASYHGVSILQKLVTWHLMLQHLNFWIICELWWYGLDVTVPWLGERWWRGTYCRGALILWMMMTWHLFVMETSIPQILVMWHLLPWRPNYTNYDDMAPIVAES